MIPYGRHDITQADIDAVMEVLSSDFLTQGPKVPEFEKTVACYVNARHAVATNSATSALHLACIALDVKAGDWLWTTPITFVASANCGLYCGARVDFVDIDPGTWNLSTEALERKLEWAKKNDCLPKVLVVVHLCGEPCDMRAIHELSGIYGFHIIEDASHAIGGRYRDEPIGGCRYSDITIFSFHPVKVVTSGEGGMATTNSDFLAHRMAMLRGHGITRDPTFMSKEPEGPWYYEMQELGFNYRMTDLQAALGISQMSRLNAYVAKRHEHAARYNRLLDDMSVCSQHHSPDGYAAMHLYVVRVPSEFDHLSHRGIFDALRAEGVGVNLHYIPVHTQPYYRSMGFKAADFPEAMKYYREAITLPLFYNLTEQEQDHVVDALGRALRSSV